MPIFRCASGIAVEGIYRFKTDKRLALATIENYTKTKTTTESEQVYEIYANRYVKRAPEITSEGMQTVLEEITESRSLPSGIGPQRFLNSRYFKEVSRKRLRGRALPKPLTFLEPGLDTVKPPFAYIALPTLVSIVSLAAPWYRKLFLWRSIPSTALCRDRGALAIWGKYHISRPTLTLANVR